MTVNRDRYIYFLKTLYNREQINVGKVIERRVSAKATFWDKIGCMGEVILFINISGYF